MKWHSETSWFLIKQHTGNGLRSNRIILWAVSHHHQKPSNFDQKLFTWHSSFTKNFLNCTYDIDGRITVRNEWEGCGCGNDLFYNPVSAATGGTQEKPWKPLIQLKSQRKISPRTSWMWGRTAQPQCSVSCLWGANCKWEARLKLSPTYKELHQHFTQVIGENHRSTSSGYWNWLPYWDLNLKPPNNKAKVSTTTPYIQWRIWNVLSIWVNIRIIHWSYFSRIPKLHFEELFSILHDHLKYPKVQGGIKK